MTWLELGVGLAPVNTAIARILTQSVVTDLDGVAFAVVSLSTWRLILAIYVILKHVLLFKRVVNAHIDLILTISAIEWVLLVVHDHFIRLWKLFGRVAVHVSQLVDLQLLALKVNPSSL